jgi:opacity protein-like surface antigen
MKKTLTIAALCVVLLLIPPSSRGLDIQLRLSSGLWQMKLGEVNAALVGWRDGLKQTADVDPNMQFVSGDGGRLRLGVDFEAELVLSFSRWIKLGLSAGYGYGSLDEKATLLTIEQAGTLFERARPTKVSAFPFLVSGYFNLPLGRKFNVYLRAGVGAIQARYVSREAQKKVTDTRFTYPAYDNAKAGRLTYLGGLGLSYSFDQSLGFFIEAAAQFARVDGFTGENLLEQKGILYSYEEYLPQAGFWRPTMHVLSEEPGGANVRNVREAVVDFGGYSIKIGLLLRF